jgi:hypothetical protein
VPEDEVRWLKGPTITFKPEAYWEVERPPISANMDFLGELMSGTSDIAGIRA